MANLSDVIKRLKDEGNLTRNSGTNSLKANKEILSNIVGINTGILEVMNAQQSNDLEVMNAQQSNVASDEIKEQIQDNEDKENASESKSHFKGLRESMKDIKSTFSNAKDGMFTLMKLGVIGLLTSVLGGPLAGPLLMLLGAATGNTAILAVGALSSLFTILRDEELMASIKAIGKNIKDVFFGTDEEKAAAKKALKAQFDAIWISLKDSIDGVMGENWTDNFIEGLKLIGIAIAALIGIQAVSGLLGLAFMLGPYGALAVAIAGLIGFLTWDKKRKLDGKKKNLAEIDERLADGDITEPEANEMKREIYGNLSLYEANQLGLTQKARTDLLKEAFLGPLASKTLEFIGDLFNNNNDSSQNISPLIRNQLRDNLEFRQLSKQYGGVSNIVSISSPNDSSQTIISFAGGNSITMDVMEGTYLANYNFN